MTPDMPIELRGVGKSFRVDGRHTPALQDVSLYARAQEFVALIGPSGCGKSTLLNLISGLMIPDVGQILLHGSAQASRIGRVGYMPQRDLLLPWRRLLENVVLGVEVSPRSKEPGARERARAEALALLPLFGLEGFENAYPVQLSGGMRQRAALMRTFLCKQDLVLMDEPFGALDALTRRGMRRWLLDVWARFRQTAILVTHDVEEAIYLSDRVYVLSPRPGHIVHELSVELPRPREEEMVLGATFVAYRREILCALGLWS